MARLLQMLFGAGAWLACTCVCSAQAALKLDTSACSEAWANGLPRFIAIELEGKSEGALAIEVRCEGSSVEIRAQESEGVATERRMELRATAEEVRGRVVALAVAGLVKEMEVMGEKRATSTNTTTTPPTPTTTTPTTTPTSTSASTSTDASTDEVDGEEDSEPYSIQLELFFAPSVFTAASDVVWGGGVRAQWLAVWPIYLALDGQLGAYGRDEALGSGRFFMGSFAARAGYALEWGTTAFALGAGPRVGYARASARANSAMTDAAAVSGTWVAPVAFVRLDTGLSARVRLGLDAELGAVLVPVRGRIEGGDDIAADGAWLALSASLGLRF